MYCADTECVQPSAKTACKSGTPPVAWGTLTASARTRRRRKGRVRRVRRRSGGVSELRLSFVYNNQRTRGGTSRALCWQRDGGALGSAAHHPTATRRVGCRAPPSCRAPPLLVDAAHRVRRRGGDHARACGDLLLGLAGVGGRGQRECERRGRRGPEPEPARRGRAASAEALGASAGGPARAAPAAAPGPGLLGLGSIGLGSVP